MGKLALRLWELGAITEEKDIKILRFSALLHDIGHYPLSHLAETVYKKIEQDKTDENRNLDILVVSTEEKNSSSDLSLFAIKPSNDEAHHEKLGALVICKREDIYSVLKKDGIEPEDVGKIIQGKHSNKLFNQCMHSSFDADRLDYLLRDSAHAGVIYGKVDLDYLTRLVMVGYFTDDYLEEMSEDEKIPNDLNKESFIGINLKGLHVLEHYLMARYFSYSQVTFHKISISYETIMQTYIYKLAKEKEIYKDFEEIEKIIDKDDFLAFDDSYIWKKLDPSISSNQVGWKVQEPYITYRDTLIERKKIRIVAQYKDVVNIGIIDEKPTSKASALEDLLKNKYGIIEEIFKKYEVDIHFVGWKTQKLSIEYGEKKVKNFEKEFDESTKLIKKKNDKNECIFLFNATGSMIANLLNSTLSSVTLFYIDKIGEVDSEQLYEKIKIDIKEKIMQNTI